MALFNASVPVIPCTYAGIDRIHRIDIIDGLMPHAVGHDGSKQCHVEYVNHYHSARGMYAQLIASIRHGLDIYANNNKLCLKLADDFEPTSDYLVSLLMENAELRIVYDAIVDVDTTLTKLFNELIGMNISEPSEALLDELHIWHRALLNTSKSLKLINAGIAAAARQFSIHDPRKVMNLSMSISADITAVYCMALADLEMCACMSHIDKVPKLSAALNLDIIKFNNAVDIYRTAKGYSHINVAHIPAFHDMLY